MMTVSAVVLIKNHRRHVRPCLTTLAWVDEIIVMNDGSSDGSLAIAAEFPNVRVIDRALDFDWAAQMNAGIDAARGAWVLQIDADERVPEPLAEELAALMRRDDVDGIGLRIMGTFLGQAIGAEPGAPTAVRAVRRGTGRFESRRVHARLHIDGAVVDAEEPLVHLGPFPTAASFWQKNTFYAELEARSNVESGTRLVRPSTTGYVVQFVLKPLGVFLRKYFSGGAFRRGIRGFHFAAMRAIGYYMVHLATWEKQVGGQDEVETYCKEHGIPYLDGQ